MVRELWLRLRPEVPRFARFACVGGFLLGLTFVSYALLARIWPQGPSWAHYGVTTVAMTVLNFILNSRLTFASGASDWRTKARFAGVAGIATVLNNILFWVGHVWLGFSDFAIIAADALCIAIFTFATHRFFTFHPDPWRFFRAWRPAAPAFAPVPEALALEAEPE